MNFKLAVASPRPQDTPTQVVNRVLASGKITTAERYWFLQATLADDPLNWEEWEQVREIFDRLQMGLIKVVD